MNKPTPYPSSEGVVPVGMAVVLTLVTCGIYGLFWRYKQFQVLNAWSGREDHNFGLYLLLSIVTCGFYGMYYEYVVAQSINTIQHNEGIHVNDSLPLTSVLLAVFGLWIISFAIQQSDINAFFGERSDYS